MFVRFVRHYHAITGRSSTLYLFGGRVRIGRYVPGLFQFGAEIHPKGSRFAYFAMFSAAKSSSKGLSFERVDFGKPRKTTYITILVGRFHVDIRPEGTDWDREFSMVTVTSDRAWGLTGEVKTL